MRMSNAELRRIQHHEHFGRESLGGRLASFAANQAGNRIPLLVQALLKTPQPGDAIAHRSRLPLRLRSLGTQHGSVHVAGACRRQLRQHLSGGGIRGHDHATGCDSCFACHIQYSTLTR